MKNFVTENEIEEMFLEFFSELGYKYKHGDELESEGRSDLREVILEERLRRLVRSRRCMS